MALNLNTITDRDGNTFTDAYGVVETVGTDANLGVWTDSSMLTAIRFDGLGGIYQVVEGQEEDDTIAILATHDITATKIA